MLDKIEKSILQDLKKKPVIRTYPAYYEMNGVLIREEQDGSKYQIILDAENNEKIIKKL